MGVSVRLGANSAMSQLLCLKMLASPPSAVCEAKE